MFTQRLTNALLLIPKGETCAYIAAVSTVYRYCMFAEECGWSPMAVFSSFIVLVVAVIGFAVLVVFAVAFLMFIGSVFKFCAFVNAGAVTHGSATFST